MLVIHMQTNYSAQMGMYISKHDQRAQKRRGEGSSSGVCREILKETSFKNSNFESTPMIIINNWIQLQDVRITQRHSHLQEQEIYRKTFRMPSGRTMWQQNYSCVW